MEEMIKLTFAEPPKNNNLEAFKQLAERYETITLEEIENSKNHVHWANAMRYLTGFGSVKECSLCRAAGRKQGNLEACYRCLWLIAHDEACTNTKGYIDIQIAANPQRLLYAYRRRAEIMRETIAKYEAMMNPPKPKSKWTKFKELIQKGIDRWKKWV